MGKTRVMTRQALAPKESGAPQAADGLENSAAQEELEEAGKAEEPSWFGGAFVAEAQGLPTDTSDTSDAGLGHANEGAEEGLVTLREVLTMEGLSSAALGLVFSRLEKPGSHAKIDLKVGLALGGKVGGVGVKAGVNVVLKGEAHTDDDTQFRTDLVMGMEVYGEVKAWILELRASAIFNRVITTAYPSHEAFVEAFFGWLNAAQDRLDAGEGAGSDEEAAEAEVAEEEGAVRQLPGESQTYEVALEGADGTVADGKGVTYQQTDSQQHWTKGGKQLDGLTQAKIVSVESGDLKATGTYSEVTRQLNPDNNGSYLTLEVTLVDPSVTEVAWVAAANLLGSATIDGEGGLATIKGALKTWLERLRSLPVRDAGGEVSRGVVWHLVEQGDTLRFATQYARVMASVSGRAEGEIPLGGLAKGHGEVGAGVSVPTYEVAGTRTSTYFLTRYNATRRNGKPEEWATFVQEQRASLWSMMGAFAAGLEPVASEKAMKGLDWSAHRAALFDDLGQPRPVDGALFATLLAELEGAFDGTPLEAIDGWEKIIPEGKGNVSAGYGMYSLVAGVPTLEHYGQATETVLAGDLDTVGDLLAVGRLMWSGGFPVRSLEGAGDANALGREILLGSMARRGDGPFSGIRDGRGLRRDLAQVAAIQDDLAVIMDHYAGNGPGVDEVEAAGSRAAQTLADAILGTPLPLPA